MATPSSETTDSSGGAPRRSGHRAERESVREKNSSMQVASFDNHFMTGKKSLLNPPVQYVGTEREANPCNSGGRIPNFGINREKRQKSKKGVVNPGKAYYSEKNTIK